MSYDTKNTRYDLINRKIIRYDKSLYFLVIDSS